jgi:hypothetical protein
MIPLDATTEAARLICAEMMRTVSSVLDGMGVDHVPTFLAAIDHEEISVFLDVISSNAAPVLTAKR